VLGTVLLEGRAEGWIGRDLRGNGPSLLEVLLSHLTGGSVKTH
jgi:hypothetical protein